MMKALKKILAFLRDIWLIVGVTILILLLLEFGFAFIFFVRDSLVDAAEKTDFRANADTYSGQDWPREYYREFDKCSLRWEPYVYWRQKPCKGKYINVDSAGIRKTWASWEAAKKTAPRLLKIYMFGGSTMWGTGARDDFTIPSLLAKKLSEKGIASEIVNFGESGYVTTQELITLMLELRRGNIPDIVIFYDGINDAFSAWQQKAAGLPQNEYNRFIEFNLRQPERQKELRGMIIPDMLKELSLVRLIRDLRGRLGLLRKWKAPKSVRSLVSSPGDANKNKTLPEQVIDVYRQNVEQIEALAAKYGFKCIFYWQPSIFQKKKLSSYELKQKDRQLPLGSFLLETCKSLSSDRSLKERKNFHDISLIFSDSEEPLFVDWCHPGERGNGIVADRMAKDVISFVPTLKHD